jgi:hypothetical protein
MPKGETQIEVTGIGKVLSNRPLQVPVHQRPYSWRSTQVSELLDDIGGAFERKEEHFLGSLVFVTPQKGERATVLDGQQRLATVALLLAVVAHDLESRSDTKRAFKIRELYLHSFDIQSGTDRAQLKLSETDALFFEELAKAGATAPAPAKGAPESHKRLVDARLEIVNWLARKTKAAAQPVQWLADLVQFVHESVYVISFSVADDANAFLIFETLNDRGLDLSVADLLKNFLLGRSGETSLWLTISELTADEQDELDLLRFDLSTTLSCMRDRIR